LEEFGSVLNVCISTVCLVNATDSRRKNAKQIDPKIRQIPHNHTNSQECGAKFSGDIRKPFAGRRKSTNGCTVFHLRKFQELRHCEKDECIMIQSTVIEQRGSVFVERRQCDAGTAPVGSERRQFRDGDRSARPEVVEFANAVDDYKIAHRRRFITFEELFDVMTSIGYHK
jgi:hypothetical protein